MTFIFASGAIVPAWFPCDVGRDPGGGDYMMQTLALASVANLGGNDLYEALLPVRMAFCGCFGLPVTADITVAVIVVVSPLFCKGRKRFRL